MSRAITATLQLAFLILLAIAWHPSDACAQGPYAPNNRTYVPRTSPLPIYLDYFRRDVGVLDPYNTFVVPQRQLNQTLRNQQYRINGLQQEQQSMRNGLNGGLAPTGTSARFFNYSHYYPGMRNP